MPVTCLRSGAGTQGTLSFQVADDGQPTACILEVYWRNPIKRNPTKGSNEYSCSAAPGSNCDTVSCTLKYGDYKHDTLRTFVGRKPT